MAASESTQYQITKQGGPWASVSGPKPTPGPGEVTIKQKSIALNPLDFKQAFFGAMVQEWPATLGIDGAGIIEAVGEGVTKVKPGDEVFAFFKGKSYQEVAPTIAAFIGLKPKSLSFDEAATLGCTYCTAAATISFNLKIPLPFVPGAASTGAKPSSILVLGGSSGVGAAAIQILRQALPDATILTTSSPKNHSHLVSLGATKAFDQNSSSLVDDIKAATPDGKGVEMIADTVGSGAQQKSIFDALSPGGPREYAAVFTGMQFEAPEGVKFSPAFAGTILQTQGGENAMEGLANLINEGKYKIAQTVKNVGSGFDAIPNGLAELKAGVSMTKLVVSV